MLNGEVPSSGNTMNKTDIQVQAKILHSSATMVCTTWFPQDGRFWKLKSKMYDICTLMVTLVL